MAHIHIPPNLTPSIPLSSVLLPPLSLSPRHVIWISLDGLIGYRLEYPQILLHAVCRDTTSFPLPCLYAQLDDEGEEEEAYAGAMRQQEYEEENDANNEDDDNEDADSSIISELRFVPAQPEILDALWSAMSACAALNPDEDLSDGEGDFLFNEGEIGYGGAAGGDDEGDYHEEDEGEEEYYGEGGENVSAYDSNEARMRGLQMSMGVSAEEMYGEDDDDATADLPPPRKSQAPDDPSAVAMQMANANAQVSAACNSNGSTTTQKKRERDAEEEQPAGPPARM